MLLSGRDVACHPLKDVFKSSVPESFVVRVLSQMCTRLGLVCWSPGTNELFH